MNSHDWDYSYLHADTPWREAANVNDVLEKSGITTGTALDLGCGTGEWAVALAEKGFDVEGLDFSAEALKIARAQSDKVTWVQWDLELLANYSFKHSTYDLIIDHKVLAFIKDKDQYLNTVASVLSGVYVLTIFHEHDEKPIICVPRAEFDRLISNRFEIIRSDVFNPRPGKVIATYYLANK